jgi:hypothetical protein
MSGNQCPEVALHSLLYVPPSKILKLAGLPTGRQEADCDYCSIHVCAAVMPDESVMVAFRGRFDWSALSALSDTLYVALSDAMKQEWRLMGYYAVWLL